MKYPATELVLNNANQVYHLGLDEKNVAHKIILVGDQDRVALVSNFFDNIEHKSQHREFVCHTGMYQGTRISAISTGIGTDNIDIVINELDAIFNIDLNNREDQPNFTKLELVRIGTCGILQPEIPVHSYILSSHACGLDNIAHFYEIPFDSSEKEINNLITEQIKLPDHVQTYVCSASEALIRKLSSEKTYNGITITSSGFYGPQGRELRLKTKTRLLNDRISAFRKDNLKIVNFEMESSALFSLGKALGHDCATICLGIANRPNKKFSSGYSQPMNELIQYVLERLK